MYCIFSFRSRQEAMRLYNTAKQRGIAVSIISTPQYVYSGCGLSVKSDMESYQSLFDVFVSMNFNSFYGAYRVRNNNGKVYSERIM